MGLCPPVDEIWAERRAKGLNAAYEDYRDHGAGQEHREVIDAILEQVNGNPGCDPAHQVFRRLNDNIATYFPLVPGNDGKTYMIFDPPY
jgi:hypothetical protein